MFIVTFSIETNRQWHCEFTFPNYSDAEEYLIQKGFIKKDRTFEKKSNGWFPTTKAFVNPVKVLIFNK